MAGAPRSTPQDRAGREPAEPASPDGGSVLAGEWEHRESIDIDLLLPERRSIDDLGPRKRLDLEAATGGTIIRQTRYRITARTPEGVLDVTAMKPELEGCEREIEIEGATETVLSIAQILRGKLARIKKALPRDAFDLITAATAAPAALEIAVNALSPQQRRTAKTHLRDSNEEIAIKAGETLAGVPRQYETPSETMGIDAAEALRQHEYTRVQIYNQERHQRPDLGPSPNTPSDEPPRTRAGRYATRESGSTSRRTAQCRHTGSRRRWKR